MRFRQFFLKHEETSLLLFHSLGGAASALIMVAAIESDIRYLFAAVICVALGLSIWTYGYTLERQHLAEYLETNRDAIAAEFSRAVFRKIQANHS